MQCSSHYSVKFLGEDDDKPCEWMCTDSEDNVHGDFRTPYSKIIKTERSGWSFFPVGRLHQYVLDF